MSTPTPDGPLLEVSVDLTCISSGFCRQYAPEIFGSVGAGRSFVKSNSVADSDDLRDAMESCPVEAISARDAETSETVFP